MSLATAHPTTDLHLPLPPDGVAWDPHTIHTHYFGFSIPEAQIGCFIYIRYQPAFRLCGAGVSIYQGTDNHTPLDASHLDYVATAPWPEIHGTTITTMNGLTIDFLEPGRMATIRYESSDGRASFFITQTALTALVARGHVMPGEEDHHSRMGASGGSEQFMHCTGTLTLGSQTFPIDCTSVRDRSWSQVRTEQRPSVDIPPIGWSPMYFGPDLAVNQVGWEHPDTNPAWADLHNLPPDQPTHHFGYVMTGSEIRPIVDVRRNVLEYDPVEFSALRQELDIRDDIGREFHFDGEAIALCPVPAWPNLMAHDSVYRWKDSAGRFSFGPYQEMWSQTYHHAMVRGRRANLDELRRSVDV